MTATYLILASPGAGSASSDALDEVVAALGGPSRACVREVDGPRSLGDALDALGDRTLVLAGGDGSVHHALGALHLRQQRDRPVGLVPMGTGNDLARSLGLPVDDPAAAARRVAAGTARPVDLLVDQEGGVVVNAVHLGAGADGAERSAGLKGRLGPLAYPVGAVLAGLRRPRWRLRVEVDGVLLTQDRLLQVAIGNGSTVGGGTELLPGASPADGRLDVLATHAVSLPARLGYGLAVRLGRQRRRQDTVLTQGSAVTVTVVGRTPVPVAADGELSTLTGTRTWTVEPHAWQLLD